MTSGNGSPEPEQGGQTELDRVIRAKIEEMVQSGKSRAEVERFVGRFRLGSRYLDQLDGMFMRQTLPPSSRRRGLRRLLGFR
jgi:hypothetical protein